MTKEALARTLLLMRTDLDPGVSDDELLQALRAVEVTVSAGPDACATHSGQSAVVATVLTLSRSGHSVWLDCPDAPIIGRQPPLSGDTLRSALAETCADLLPRCRLRAGPPPRADVSVAIGAAADTPADLNLRFDADDWSARMGGGATAWSGGDWPMGALAVAPLAAAEAFKTAMRSLRRHASSPDFFDLLHAPCATAELALAPKGTPRVSALPVFDVVSGGAIANALLFALLRLPRGSGSGRVLDDDVSATGNLNRNALLRRSAVGIHKVADLARIAEGTGVSLEAEPRRFEEGMPLAPSVLVGVDDIPSRWAVERSSDGWTGVGATDRFSVLVSSHEADQPCSGCLHPVSPPPSELPIATCAFVSYLAGLLLAARWLRLLAGEEHGPGAQQTFLNALRPESWSYGSMPVAPSAACPVRCAASRMAMAA